MTITNLDYKIQQVLPTVYDDSLSFYELVNKVVEKLNQVIDETNEYFNGTYIEESVSSTLTNWKNDGTLESMINDQILANKTDQSYTEEIAVNVTGLIGDGSDETDKIQTVLNANPGKRIIFPRGKSYKINTLNIPDNTIIEGYGVKLYNDTIHQSLLRVGNGVRIKGLELEGAGSEAYDPLGIGIEISGTYLNPAIDWKENVIIEDCHIHSVGRAGIEGEYSRNVTIKDCQIENVAVYGILGLSVDMWIIEGNHIDGIVTGTGSTLSPSSIAYGIALSKQCFLGADATQMDMDADLQQFPRSRNCIVKNNIVENNTIWEGIDTHAGENILFEGNSVLNCKVGIAVVNIARSVSGTEYNYYAPNNVRVIGNYIEGIGTGYGISLSGSESTPRTATPNEFSTGCIIADNTLVTCGEQGNSISGGIYTRASMGLVIAGNNLDRPFAHGINLYTTNKDAVVTGNTIIDPNDNTFTAPGGIVLRSGNNEAVVSGNTLIKNDPSINTYVAIRGVYVAGTPFELTLGNNRNTFDTLIYGANGQNTDYLTYGTGTSKLYSGTGTPEGTIVADIGSIYINLNGGAAATLYVKESGNGLNTGWIAK